jgi:thiamine biosynthesis lipoprotein
MSPVAAFRLILLAAALCGGLLSCAPRRVAVTETRIALGTYVRIQVVVPPREQTRARRALDDVYGEILRLGSDFDYRSVGGGLARFNDGTRLLRREDPLLFSLLQEALAYARETGGRFDPTILPIIRLWGFDTDEPHLPDDESIRRALHRVGYEQVRVEDGTIVKPPGVTLDLSGIAKGKIVDVARLELRKAGYDNFLVDAGGDITVRGTNARGEPWRIAIQDPRHANDYVGVLQKTDVSIITSGDYERYFMEGGKRYSHLFDPATGYPATDLTSVTVIADEAAFGDAVATAVFVMGRDEGYDFLVGRGIEGLLIYRGSDGLERRATPGFWR